MDEVPNARGYHKMVLAKSDQVYSKEGDLPVDAPITDKEELDTMVELERSRAAAGMLTISGTSRTCEVQLGRKVQILMPTRAPMRDIDEFMVTYIEHHVNEADKYSNTFKGILSDLLAIPMEPVEPPRTGNQQATVMSNADPENKGRVQVQLQWQKGLGKSTNWIRVQTPDAGSSGKVKSNRGFVCIPEVGDSVMVGFDYGDPNRPYVMGSVFSELTGAGGGEGNKGKSIVSRSGNALKLDDEQGSVVLQDKGGACMNFDGEGNATTRANTSSTTTVGDGACLLKMDKDGVIDLGGKTKIRFEIDENTYIEMTAGKIKISAENVNLIGTEEATIGKDATASTGMKVVANDDVVAIAGTTINIAASGGNTTVTGGQVDIN